MGRKNLLAGLLDDELTAVNDTRPIRRPVPSLSRPSARAAPSGP